MEALTELLKSAEIVVGLLVTVFATVAAGLAWWDRRHRRQLHAHTGKLESGHEAIAGEIKDVRGTLKRVDRDLDMLRGRVATIETALAKLASKEDLHAISVSVARLEVIVQQSSQKTDTIYRAAIARSKDEA